jgi:hypothetical protein
VFHLGRKHGIGAVGCSIGLVQLTPTATTEIIQGAQVYVAVYACLTYPPAYLHIDFFNGIFDTCQRIVHQLTAQLRHNCSSSLFEDVCRQVTILFHPICYCIAPMLPNVESTLTRLRECCHLFGYSRDVVRVDADLRVHILKLFVGYPRNSCHDVCNRIAGCGFQRVIEKLINRVHRLRWHTLIVKNFLDISMSWTFLLKVWPLFSFSGVHVWPLWCSLRFESATLTLRMKQPLFVSNIAIILTLEDRFFEVLRVLCGEGMKK